MDKHICTICNKTLSDKYTLKRHYLKCKSNKKSIDEMIDKTCIHCGKIYYNKYTRLRHQKTCVKIEKPPANITINNINNNNIINIENLNITKDTDFYKELTKKMGERQAIDFIARAAIEGNAMGIFEKLYLTDKDVESYPLACRDNIEYRFKEKDKLTSKKAREMSDMINEKVVNCIINASIYIVNQSLKGNEDFRETMFDGIYNLKKIQGAAQKLNLKKELFFNRLTKKIKIKNHPFFLRSIDE